MPENRSTGGFTLLEMMAVVVLMGIFISMVSYQWDLGDMRSRQEIDQLTTYIRLHLARSFRVGRKMNVTVNVKSNTFKLHSSVSEGRLFHLGYWDIESDKETLTLSLTPSGFHGPDEITLKSGSRTRVLKSDRLMGLRLSDETDEF